MDLALQAFLNILTPKEMSVMLTKLDGLASAHKSTMSAKWHEVRIVRCVIDGLRFEARN